MYDKLKLQLITKEKQKSYYKEFERMAGQLDSDVQRFYRKLPILSYVEESKFETSNYKFHFEKDKLYFAFLDNNNIIGYSVISLFNYFFKVKEPNVSEFFIKKEYRGKGYSKLFMNMVLDLFESKSKRMHITVLVNNIPAYKSYLKTGFKTHSVVLSPFKGKNTSKVLGFEEVSNLKDFKDVIHQTSFDIISFYKKNNLPYQNISNIILNPQNFQIKISDNNKTMLCCTNKNKLVSYIYYGKEINLNLLRMFLYTLKLNKILMNVKVPITSPLFKEQFRSTIYPSTFIMTKFF